MKTVHGIVFLFVISLNISTVSTVSAARKYSPNDVFANVEYSSRLMDALLEKRAISDLVMPDSMENQARPMHVYELHIAVLTEIYDYALKNGRQPPPLPSSTPIHYTPTDVFYLTFIIRDHIRSIYMDDGLPRNVEMVSYKNKTLSDVYRELFKPMALNEGQAKIEHLITC